MPPDKTRDILLSHQSLSACKDGGYREEGLLLAVNHGQFLIQMTHKSKHNNAGFSWPVPGNPRRGKISIETSLENEDLKFSVSNGVDLILDHNFNSFFGVKTTEGVKMTQIYRLKFRPATERKRTTRNGGAERTSLSTAKATPSAKKQSGYSDHKHGKEAAYNYTANETDEEREHRLPTLQEYAATRIRNESNEERQRLKFTVKIIFFDATLGSKNYGIRKMHVNNIFPTNGGQPISLYTMSINGLFYNEQVRTPIMCDM